MTTGLPEEEFEVLWDDALRHGLGFTMSAAGHNPQSIGQALGHKSARMVIQFYGAVTDEVADQARRQTFAKYS
jgi:hypothetical protein